MPYQRSHAAKTFNHMYTYLNNNGICVYCGMQASGHDHFVPLSVVSAIAGIVEYIHGTVLVPCCGECNSTAGNKLFPTVAAKRRWIQFRYRKKYNRIIAMKDWTVKELQEISWALQTTVRSGMIQKEILRQRLGWRNTKNPAAVNIAAIRLSIAGFGSNFAQSDARIPGIPTSDRMQSKSSGMSE